MSARVTLDRLAAATAVALALVSADPAFAQIAVSANDNKLTLVDGETGREVRVDTSSVKLRDKFAEAAAQERASLAADFARAQARHIVLSTSGDWLRSLVTQLRFIGAIQ